MTAIGSDEPISVDAILAQQRESAQKLDEAAQQLGAARAMMMTAVTSMTDPRRLVTVGVGVNGALRDLRLSSDAMQLSAPELAELILATQRRAVAKAAERTQQALSTIAPPGSAFSEALLDAQREYFAVTDAPEQTAAPADPDPGSAQVRDEPPVRSAGADERGTVARTHDSADEGSDDASGWSRS